MDKEQRGRLLVDQEETENKIKSIRDNLKKAGTALKDLSGALSSEPESIIFANAPDPLGSFDMFKIASKFSFNWPDLPNFEAIAKLIQELRKETQRLSEIKNSLRG